MGTDIKSAVNERFKQYSTVRKTSFTNTVQYSRRYTPEEAEMRVNSLDPRVYRDPTWIGFYIKAVQIIEWPRIMELQSMVLRDKRLNKPGEFNPEKVFSSLLNAEMKRTLNATQQAPTSR